MPLPVCSFSRYKKEHPAARLSDYEQERSQVQGIIQKVRLEGDSALLEYTQRFDGVSLDLIQVVDQEFDEAQNSIQPELLEAIRGAKDNIQHFHRQQVASNWWSSGPGWLSGQRNVPLETVGAYIPGGTAAYPSSVLMTVVPAHLAGVENIYLASPPDKEGKVNPVTLVAAREAGVTAVYKVGGAQAIAAFAYGSESVVPVQKIVGPGNIYVTLAKKEVFGDVGIDMLAGPSEIVIAADEKANPDYIAADLLSQAEHDPLSRPIVVTYSKPLAERILKSLDEQLAALPRQETAEKSLQHQGAVIMVDSVEDIWPVINEIAPEHLELHIEQAWTYLERVKSAGAVFIGEFTPEALGDYWAGSNHVLPTASAARYASGLGTYDFLKRSNVICYSREALLQAAPHITALARAEGLEAHARSVLRRDNNDPKLKG